MPNRKGRHLEEAVILCGGLGTRLRDVDTLRPKALFGVRGRPFLEWLLLSLVRHDGIGHVILATGHLGELIEQHFGYGLWCGVRLSYSHEAQPLGTAGALRLAASHGNSQDLLVLNGDTYCRFDSRRLLDAHLDNSATATLWLSRAQDMSRFGGVAMDAKGRISGFREKAAAGRRQLASAGVYVVQSDVIAQIEPGRAVSLEREVFPALIGRGLFGVLGDGAFVDIGTPESLKAADLALAGELDQLDCD